MVAEKPNNPVPWFRRQRLAGVFFVLSVACLLAGAFVATRADEIGSDGLFITVPNPIADNDVLQIKARVNDAVEHGRTLEVVIFDFNPQGKPAGTSSVYPCIHLKDFISDLGLGKVIKNRTIKTVAFIQEEVTDHTVLPILACREIVMASKGKLGDILRSNDNLTKESEQAYKDAFQIKPHPEWLKKMLEPSKNLSLFDQEEAQKIGLCVARVESRPDLKIHYNLRAQSLREDALLDRTPIVWRIEIHGALDGGKLNSLERRTREAIRKKANTIVLHLDCEGGETRDAAATAEKIRKLTDDGGVLPVKTIAFVPPGRSLGAATFLAIGCSEIAMAPDAKLGGFDYLKTLDAKELAEKRKMLVSLAHEQGYHTAFFQAMLDPQRSIYLCRHKTRPGAFAVLTDADLAQNDTEWTKTKTIFTADTGEFLSLDANTAKHYGIAVYDDITSPERLYERYGFDSTKVQTSRDDWLDAVALFLRAPAVNVILIMVGIAGLILELKIPGFGVPGIVSALCFVLFFWAHAFAGQSTWEFTLLAILLFLLGIILLGIEIFLLPGFGVTGISGVALIVISLMLVLLEQMPSTSQEWTSLGAAFTTVAIGLVGGMAGAVMIARFLPNIPYANRLVLAPPVEQEQTGDFDLTQEGLHAAALLGSIGVAETTLRPAGKARFGEEFLDVVAENDFVAAGARVQVIEIEGNRIVVKEVGV
jgi:membrane-bound serine protease (ClpP class)